MIRWSTDLHLDHLAPAARETFLAQVSSVPADGWIVTGDTATAATLVASLDALGDASGGPIWFVLGNHDHYGGGVGTVRDAVLALAARRPAIRWLPPAGVITLPDGVGLVGVDGWADGRHGDPLTTPLVLNDDRLIDELAAQPTRLARLAVKRALADADAARLERLLAQAVGTHRRIVVATHVPPFPEALPPTGRLARPEWLPLLVSGATGEVLRRTAAAYPEHRFLVLAGHSHAARDVLVRPNLRCVVGGARYGAPAIVPLPPERTG